jgi:EAL domain-containing protein (putative c-di-GMP-specific phosphodiesterase class I)
VNTIKIDRSFVMNMERDSNDIVIVRSTIELGRNLGLRVIADGVEEETAWRRLASLDCDYAQGYFLSRPLPATEVDVFVSAHNDRQPQAGPVAPREAVG